MLDERWSEDVEEIGEALRRMLASESSIERVRAAEDTSDGIDAALAAQLDAFGLMDLDGSPELFARIAMEMGRALAATDYVETLPVLALAKIPGVALSWDGPVPATIRSIAVRRADGVFVEPVSGVARKSAAGDRLVVDSEARDPTPDCERIGGDSEADWLSRFAALVASARIVGAGQALLAYGANYVGEREQFGKPIGAYQGVAHRLARAAGALDAADLLVRKSAFSALPDVGGDGAPSAAFAAMVWAKASEAGRLVATEVHQVFGGNGFAMEYDVQLFSRRLRSWTLRRGRASRGLADLARTLLDPGKRDEVHMLWHYETGMPLPRWAAEAESAGRT